MKWRLRKIETKVLRNCFGHFATGVTIVTYKDKEGNNKGITLNSFTSVSLDPALALISIDNKANSLDELKGNSFVINILSSDQRQLALQFAGKPQEDLMVEWEKETEYGPVLGGTLATIECACWAEYPGGDHTLFVGEVKDFDYTENESLIFYKGQFLQSENNEIIKIKE